MNVPSNPTNPLRGIDVVQDEKVAPRTTLPAPPPPPDDEGDGLLGVDESTWPAHLRDDAPTARCGRCGRETVDAELFGQEDRMPQPDSYPCGGRFTAPPTAPRDREALVEILEGRAEITLTNPIERWVLPPLDLVDVVRFVSEMASAGVVSSVSADPVGMSLALYQQLARGLSIPVKKLPMNVVRPSLRIPS